MPYQVGQLVQCKRALHPGHMKLVGCIGEVVLHLSPLETFVYGFEYAVFFPVYPDGFCPYCDKHHQKLHFMMLERELKPVEDPDQGIEEITDHQLPEEIEA